MTASLQVAAGDGWVARRYDGVLFVGDAWPEVLEAFCAAGDTDAAQDAVTSAALAAAFEVPSFVIVTWGARVDCLVFGDVEVRSEDPSAPMLSAAGSSTWVERRLRPGDEGTLRVWAGAPGVAGSALGAGVVPAGGFELHLGTGDLDDQHQSPDARLAAANPEPAPVEPAFEPEPEPEPVPGPEPEPVRVDTVPADALESKVSGMEALVAATGGDWMEESLGLRSGGTAVPIPSTEPGSPGDDPDSMSGATSSDGSHGQRADDDTGAVERIAVPPGLDDAESTWIPDTSVAPRAAAALPPPTMPPRGVVLALAVLPDGSTVPVDGTIVIGRNPNRVAARTDDDARLIVVDSANSISRTHLALHVRGEAMTATDCGSRGGVVVATEGREPVMLEPWVPQEISVGDVLYLGGPHGIRMEPARGRP